MKDRRDDDREERGGDGERIALGVAKGLHSAVAGDDHRQRDREGHLTLAEQVAAV